MHVHTRACTSGSVARARQQCLCCSYLHKIEIMAQQKTVVRRNLRTFNGMRSRHACSTALRDASSRLKQLKEARDNNCSSRTVREMFQTVAKPSDGDSDVGSTSSSPCTCSLGTEDFSNSTSSGNSHTLGDESQHKGHDEYAERLGPVGPRLYEGEAGEHSRLTRYTTI